VVAVTPVATVRGLDRVTLDWQSQCGTFISSTCRVLALRRIRRVPNRGRLVLSNGRQSIAQELQLREQMVRYG